MPYIPQGEPFDYWHVCDEEPNGCTCKLCSDWRTLYGHDPENQHGPTNATNNTEG